MNRRDLLLATAVAALPFPAGAATIFDVRDFGARGDGQTLDTIAFNTAIAAAARAGGGVVRIPLGRYLCFSIRLASRVSLQFDRGAVIVAADPVRNGGRYDPPEDRGPQLYQDFGHSHWRNSLIWGDGVEDVTISGPGLILGDGLTRDGPHAPWHAANSAALVNEAAAMDGQGNKAISLRYGKRIHLSGFTIRQGGHVAILATGTEKLYIEDVSIDAERDGIDLDAVKDVTVRRCRVNTPRDDAIVIKTSLGLGEPATSENIIISDCAVSGYDVGTMLDGSFGTTMEIPANRDRPTGRIKIGTESNGAFRNILIERCRFDHCRGLAIETVDGGDIENVVARDLVMHDIDAPLFVRVGNRGRGPMGTGVGKTRGIRIADITATGIDRLSPAILAGIRNHPVADVTIARVHLGFAGGGTAADAALQPLERSDAYPEPSMFGVLPAWGLWMRHTRGIRIDRLTMEIAAGDARPPIVLDDATDTRVTNTPLWSKRRVVS